MSGFCLSCGSQLNGKETYCPKCGYDTSTLSITQVISKTGSHCISCGDKVSENDAYCMQCGGDTSQVTVSSSGTGGIMQNIYQVKENLQQSSDIKNHLKDGGLKELLVPAAFFGVSAIAIGLIISFFINLFLMKVFDYEINNFAGELLNNIELSLPEGNLSLIGTVGVWLLTCLSGFSFNLRASFEGYDFNVNGQATMGLLILLIVPIISLLLARLIRNATTSKIFKEKELGSVDGIIGALIFAVLNTVLVIIPFPIEAMLKNSLSELFSFASETGGVPDVNIGLSCIPLNVFIFSLVIGVLVLAPKFKSLKTSNSSNSLLQQSIETPVYLTKMLLVAGLFSAVSIALSAMIKALYNGIIVDDFGLVFIYAIIAIPQIMLWIATLILGGSLTINIPNYNYSVHAFTFGSGLLSLLGILLIASGVIICIYIFGKTLKNSEGAEFFKSAGLNIVFSALTIFIISFMGNFTASVIGNELVGIESFEFGFINASLINVIISIVIMAVAVFLIYLSHKVKVINLVINYLDSLPSIVYYLFTTISVLIIVLISFNSIINMFNF